MVGLGHDFVLKNVLKKLLGRSFPRGKYVFSQLAHCWFDASARGVNKRLFLQPASRQLQLAEKVNTLVFVRLSPG